MTRNTDKSIATLKFVLLTFCLFVALAIIIQDFSGFIPSCVFNRGRGIYYACSVASLVFLLTISGFILLARTRRSVFYVLVLLIFTPLAEITVRLVDTFLINRPSGLVGHYYNRESVFLMRPNSANSFGFNEGYDYTKAIPENTTRILFLGDSYTFGSGSTRDRSYCEMVEQYLNRHSGRQFEVVNAGVPGYSPYDSYELLQHLRKSGYEYDAVVFSLYLQNDLTDDIQNTYRKVVGGMIQRFPENLILEYFHPLNSYLFRYAIVIKTLAAERLASGQRNTPQQLTGEPQSSRNDEFLVSPILMERVETNYAPTATPNYDKVLAAIRGLAQEAHAPCFVAIFPDQCVTDPVTKEYVMQRIDKSRYDFTVYQQWIRDSLQPFVVIDLSPILHDCDRCYKSDDTHLNDTGNRVAGEAVAKYLLTHEFFSP